MARQSDTGVGAGGRLADRSSSPDPSVAGRAWLEPPLPK